MIIVETAVSHFDIASYTQIDTASISWQSKIGSAPDVEEASRSDSQNSLKDSLSETTDEKER